MVAITGSKFLTGPAFCGALLLPPEAAEDVREWPLHALRGYSARTDWPEGWLPAAQLDDTLNIGLLLRWEAALTELRRFRAVPPSEVERFLMVWGHAVAQRIATDPSFESLPAPSLVRTVAPYKMGWDSLQTIFPFLVYRHAANGRRVPLGRDETAALHRQMQEVELTAGPGSSGAEIESTRFQLGQPVPCGMRAEVAVSALRMCASARWVADAAGDDRGTSAAVSQAMLAFDKLAWLVRQRNCSLS
jgi:hypothetical protein